MGYLEGSEPHEPVEAVVVGGYGAGVAASGAWLALELNLLPYGHLSISPQGGVVGTFEYDLCPLLCDTGHINEIGYGRRERGREGGREEGREGGREEGGRKEGREGGRKEGRREGREGEREGGRV